MACAPAAKHRRIGVPDRGIGRDAGPLCVASRVFLSRSWTTFPTARRESAQALKAVELDAPVPYAVLIDGISEGVAADRFGINGRPVSKMLKFSVPP